MIDDEDEDENENECGHDDHEGDIEEVRSERDQHIAVAHSLARHVEALAAEVTDDEVNTFIDGCGLPGRLLNRGKVQRLLNNLITRRQRRGQFAAFGVDI